MTDEDFVNTLRELQAYAAVRRQESLKVANVAWSKDWDYLATQVGAILAQQELGRNLKRGRFAPPSE